RDFPETVRHCGAAARGRQWSLTATRAHRMPIRFYCPFCDQLLGISSRKAGKAITCPRCGGEVGVPAPGESPPVDILIPLPVPATTDVVLSGGQVAALALASGLLLAIAFAAGLLIGALG